MATGKDITIPIDSNGNGATTDVKNGDKVQWQAPAGSQAWVVPPAIFTGGCGNSSPIIIAAGTTGPDHACTVSGKKGTYEYGCGLGVPPKTIPFGDGGEIIIVDGADDHGHDHDHDHDHRHGHDHKKK